MIHIDIGPCAHVRKINMMTSQNTQETARQTLGNALRFFREQRSLSLRDLANRVGCSHTDIDDWERGKAAPPDHRWARLCKMLHDDLAGMRATWQRARAEEERERAQKAQKTTPADRLTSKPFANLPALALVPPAPPEPNKPVVPVVPVVKPPETLHDDGFDLRPAYKAVAKLPEGWRSNEAIAARRAFATGLIKQGWTNDEIRSEVKRKHGVGIELTVLAKLRTAVRETKAAEHRKAREANPSFLMTIDTRTAPAAASTADPKPMPVVKPPAVASSENDIEGAVRLILEAIPNLKSFRIEVADNGDVSVDHTIREVKVIETSGSMKLRKP